MGRCSTHWAEGAWILSYFISYAGGQLGGPPSWFRLKHLNIVDWVILWLFTVFQVSAGTKRGVVTSLTELLLLCLSHVSFCLTEVWNQTCWCFSPTLYSQVRPLLCSAPAWLKALFGWMYACTCWWALTWISSYFFHAFSGAVTHPEGAFTQRRKLNYDESIFTTLHPCSSVCQWNSHYHTRLTNNSNTRINIGAVWFCKPQICSSFTILHVNDWILWYHNVVLVIQLGWGLARFCRHKHSWKYPDVSLKISTDFVLTNVEKVYPTNINPAEIQAYLWVAEKYNTNCSFRWLGCIYTVLLSKLLSSGHRQQTCQVWRRWDEKFRWRESPHFIVSWSMCTWFNMWKISSSTKTKHRTVCVDRS